MNTERRRVLRADGSLVNLSDEQDIRTLKRWCRAIDLERVALMDGHVMLCPVGNDEALPVNVQATELYSRMFFPGASCMRSTEEVIALVRAGAGHRFEQWVIRGDVAIVPAVDLLPRTEAEATA